MRSAYTQPSETLVPQSVNQTSGWYILFLLPIFLHLWMVFRFTVNLPLVDDYTFLVDCMYRQSHELVLSHLFDELFHPHGEHIILFARLAALTDLWIEGEVNFRTLFFVGNATLIGSVWILYRLARRGGLSTWQFLPVVLLIFQPQYYDNTLTWAICALQHLPALFFAFWAFDLISRPSKWAFAFSLPLAFLALFSNGNGLAVPVCGFLLLLLLGQRKRLVIWTIFSIVSVGLFLYVHHIYHSRATDSGSNLLHPVRVLAGLFMLVGSIGSVIAKSRVILGLVGIVFLVFAGMIILTTIAYYAGWTRAFRYLPNRFRQWITSKSSQSSTTSALVLMACYLYALITLFGISFARSLGWYQGLLGSRFIWFATVGFVLTYLLLLLWLKPVYRASVSRIALVVSILFCGLSYWFTFGEVMNIRQAQLSDLHNWRENRLLTNLPSGERTFDQYYSELLQKAVDQGVYHLPPSIIESEISKLNQATIEPNLIKKDSAFAYGERQIHYLSMGNRLPFIHAFDTQEAYLLLQSSQHTFMWPINCSSTKLMLYMITGRSDWDANMVWVYADQLPPAQYKPYLAVLSDGHWTTIRSDQVLTMGTYTDKAK